MVRKDYDLTSFELIFARFGGSSKPQVSKLEIGGGVSELVKVVVESLLENPPSRPAVLKALIEAIRNPEPAIRSAVRDLSVVV